MFLFNELYADYADLFLVKLWTFCRCFAGVRNFHRMTYFTTVDALLKTLNSNNNMNFPYFTDAPTWILAVEGIRKVKEGDRITLTSLASAYPGPLR